MHVGDDADLARLAASQHGVVARFQHLDAGVGPDWIALRARQGRLHAIHRGVYAVGHRAITPDGRLLAAVLACGRDAVLSHRCAATLRHLLRPEPGAPVDVTVTRGHRRGRPGIRVHHAPVERTTHQGIPVTTPLQTLLDLAASGDRHLDHAAEQAQVLRLVTPAELASLTGRRGAVALRRTADADAAFTRSEAERRLVSLIGRAGLPRPSTNVRVHGHEVDALWPAQRLIVEVDGFAYHSTRRAFERDRARDVRLETAGYRVLRLTWRTLTTAPEAVAADLAVALRRPTSAHLP